LSKSGFTVPTSAGQKVTVHEASSTRYKKGTPSTSASAITTGQPVPVLGTTNGTTITASQVIVQPTGGGSATFSAVVPFQRVVKLSNGEYDLHNIGVSWPQHIFVNKNFKVIGAN
jgi:hypothetical protein